MSTKHFFPSSENLEAEEDSYFKSLERKKKKKIRLMVKDSFASTPPSGHIWKCPMVVGTEAGSVFAEC